MIKNILIINVNWIGDVLFTTPFIRSLREAYPESYIACLLHPRCVEMLQANPRIDEIILYDEEYEHRGFWGKFRLIREIGKRRFDTAFILHRSFTKALIAYLAGIKERIGYPTKKRSFLLTKSAEEPGHEAHKVEYFLNVARSAGIRVLDNSYEFFINKKDRDFVSDFLRKNGLRDEDLLVMLCPGGNWEPKRWPTENFAGLADALIDKYGAKIIIAGANKDGLLAEDIRLKMKGKPFIACGKTTLKELGALFERAGLVVANDTGPMHIAVAMKAPVIALFGPTSPAITGPYGSGNYKVIFKDKDASCEVPCYDVKCKDNRCMAAIKVEDVLAAADGMLTRRQILY